MLLRFGNKRADYDIVRVESDRVFIIDLDLGNKSVTNDAEYVYSDLQSLWPNRRVIYRDSMGNWDEMIAEYTTPTDDINYKVYESIIVRFQSYNEHTPNV